MKQRHLLVILCLAILTLSSCTGKSAEGDEDEPFTRETFTGTKGLEMKFSDNLPPSIVYYSPDGYNSNQELLRLSIEMRNKGAYDITDCALYLDGYDRNLLSFTPSPGTGYPCEFLEGKSNFNPEGGFNVHEFIGNLDNRWPEGLDKYDVKLKVSACYPYQTTATPLVCIDPHPFIKEEDKPCRVGTTSVAGGQGAPVAVTSINEQGTEDVVHFEIKISNVGNGVVFDRAIEGSSCAYDGICCPYNIPYNDLNMVEFTVLLSGDSPIQCKPSHNGNRVRMVDGEGTIFCTFDIRDDVDSAYKAPLQITLDYGYKDWIEEDVTIKFVGEYPQ
ncbi:MAG: hypothetical protein ABIH34_00470 [Nanoarchaeota archaeon]